METVILTFMILSLIFVFAVDAGQKRHQYLNNGRQK